MLTYFIYSLNTVENVQYGLMKSKRSYFFRFKQRKVNKASDIYYIVVVE